MGTASCGVSYLMGEAEIYKKNRSDKNNRIEKNKVESDEGDFIRRDGQEMSP